MIKTEPALVNPDCKLAIILDHRSSLDVATGIPLSDKMGSVLLNMLRKVDINVANCLVLVANDHTDSNVSVDDESVTKNVMDLTHELQKFQPNLVLLIGRLSLRLAGIERSLDNFRGSLFICEDQSSPFLGYKCMATYPAFECVRDDQKAVFAKFDLRRARSEARTPELVHPELRLYPNPSFLEVMERLRNIKSGDLISVDIEGGVPDPDSKRYPNTKGITCVGIATSPTEAFILAPWDFSEDNAMTLLREWARIAGDETIGKILQNSLYDNFVFCWLWKCMLRNVVWDTMLSGWEIYAEMPKSLEAQVSIYTRWPYYKDEREVQDKTTHYLYCLKDAAYTYEIALVHNRMLKGSSREHFMMNMQLLPAILYSELRGIRYRKEEAATALAEVKHQLEIVQTRINVLVGKPLNVNSPKQVNEHLYGKLGYEKQYKKDYKKGTQSLTSDVNALLYLLKKYDSPPVIVQILKYRALDSMRETLEIQTDADNRVRCSYNLVGTDTGRLSCSGSPTKSGANLTTIMKKLRFLYRADDDYEFGEIDLSGADGWSVAAACAAVGDNTMLDDYNYGLKPAKIIALMYNEYVEQTAGRPKAVYVSTINQLSRAELKIRCDQLSTKGWLYDACKAVQHGTNYAMKPPTMSTNLLRQSYKKSGVPVYVSIKDCDILQRLYLARYVGIKKAQTKTDGLLASTRRLKAASGNVRHFFGNINDQATQRAAYAHLPQHNTTYVTKLALLKLWTDPDNWGPDGLPIIEPLHQVHDALLMQWPKGRREWAIQLLHKCFDSPVNIEGLTITIPFEGHYGPDWGTSEGSI